MQRLGQGMLSNLVPAESELWLDGGHNPSAGRVLAQAFSELNDRHSRPLVLVWGMLNTKDVGSFIGSFAGVASRVVTITIPDEENAVKAEVLGRCSAQPRPSRRNGNGHRGGAEAGGVECSRPAHPDLRFSLSRRPRAGSPRQ
jgi:folylpolyglutamate synthase/dihydropteroate synthase